MKNLNGKALSKWQNQKHKHIKLIDNNYHIPDLVQAFSYVEILHEFSAPILCIRCAFRQSMSLQ